MNMFMPSRIIQINDTVQKSNQQCEPLCNFTKSASEMLGLIEKQCSCFAENCCAVEDFCWFEQVVNNKE